MSVLDAAKAAALLFFAAVIEVAILSGVSVLGGRPNLILVALVAVALLRGPVFGAVAGFCSGLLVDTGVFGMLGFTSLLLTLAGYWIGRYGETTGRDRAHAPLLSVAVVSVLFEVGALSLHFMLGEYAPGRLVLFHVLLPTTLLNLALTAPVYALCRRVLRPAEWGNRAREVQLLA